MKSYISLLLLILAPYSIANMEYDGNLNYAFTDNATHAISDLDIYSDRFIVGNFNVGKLWLPAVGKSIFFSGHFGFEEYAESTAYSHLSYGSSISYIQRLGLGAYAPRIGFSLRADKRKYDVELRDGWLYRANLSLQKRFTPELRAEIILSHENRTANADAAVAYIAFTNNDVFNQKNQELSASLDYTLINNSQLTARYTYRDGETDASTNPASAFFFFSNAIAQDYLVCKKCANYVVYQVDAKIHSLQLDWNWELGRDASVSFNYQRSVAHAAGNNSYTSNIYRIQLNKRF